MTDRPWPPIREARGGVPSEYLPLWCPLHQQPGRKCEERRAGCIIDFGLKREVCVLWGGLQVEEVRLIGGVPLSSDPSPFIPHPNKQWQTWRTQVPVSLMLYFNGFQVYFCSSVSGLDGESWDVSPLKHFKNNFKEEFFKVTHIFNRRSLNIWHH